MTWLEFVSTTIGQLIWPILIVVLVVWLRHPLREVLHRPLSRLKAGPGGIELEFEKGLQEAEQAVAESPPALPSGHNPPQAPAVPIPAPASPAAESEFLQKMRQLASVEPRAVVLEAHSRLEELIRQTVDAPAQDRRRYMSMNRLIAEAVRQEILPPSEASALSELTELRNDVAHSPEQRISVDQALRYAEVAQQVAITLRLAEGRTVDDGPLL